MAKPHILEKQKQHTPEKIRNKSSDSKELQVRRLADSTPRPKEKQ